MRRIKTERYALQQQVLSAANGIAGEPAWPAGAPTQVEVQALADELDNLLTQIIEAENDLQGLRSQMKSTVESSQAMLRRIDNITSGLYGIDGAGKIAFGLRPVDTTRNSPGPTPKVSGLVLSDGAAPGSIEVSWKRIPRAVYEVQWFSDSAMSQIVGSAVATRSELLIPALTPGVQVWVRLRALRGKKQGDWSDAATRIANV